MDVEDLIRKSLTQQTGDEEYERIAEGLITENEGVVRDIKEKGRSGKVQWLVGQMIRKGGKGVQPQRAEEVLRVLLGLEKK